MYTKSNISQNSQSISRNKVKGIKLKVITLPSYIEKKKLFFNSVFCQRIYKISSNEVLDETLWWPLSTLVYKIWKSKHKINDFKNEKKIERASGEGNLSPKFYKFWALFSMKIEQQKSLQSGGTYAQILNNHGTLNVFDDSFNFFC